MQDHLDMGICVRAKSMWSRYCFRLTRNSKININSFANKEIDTRHHVIDLERARILHRRARLGLHIVPASRIGISRS